MWNWEALQSVGLFPLWTLVVVERRKRNRGFLFAPQPLWLHDSSLEDLIFFKLGRWCDFIPVLYHRSSWMAAFCLSTLHHQQVALLQNLKHDNIVPWIISWDPIKFHQLGIGKKTSKETQQDISRMTSTEFGRIIRMTCFFPTFYNIIEGFKWSFPPPPRQKELGSLGCISVWIVVGEIEFLFDQFLMFHPKPWGC